jgi:hypothetical protein
MALRYSGDDAADMRPLDEFVRFAGAVARCCASLFFLFLIRSYIARDNLARCLQYLRRAAYLAPLIRAFNSVLLAIDVLPIIKDEYPDYIKENVISYLAADALCMTDL